MSEISELNRKKVFPLNSQHFMAVLSLFIASLYLIPWYTSSNSLAGFELRTGSIWMLSSIVAIVRAERQRTSKSWLLKAEWWLLGIVTAFIIALLGEWRGWIDITGF